jgi:hypothetical protein
MLNGTPKVTTMEQRACPFMGGQDCVGAKCALWMRYDRADGHAFEACCFVLNVILQEQTIIEQIRTQASGDKVATNLRDGFGALAAVVAGPRLQVLEG